MYICQGSFQNRIPAFSSPAKEERIVALVGHPPSHDRGALSHVEQPRETAGTLDN
jgi:hypothetical protein